VILSIRREPIVVNTGFAIYFLMPSFTVTVKKGPGRDAVRQASISDSEAFLGSIRVDRTITLRNAL
jgi:hypothetical protein